MINKKALIIGLILVLSAAAAGLAFLTKNKPEAFEEVQTQEIPQKHHKHEKKQQIVYHQDIPAENANINKIADTYYDKLYDMPFMSVNEISKLPDNIKKSVDEVLANSQGIYFLKQNPTTKEVLILLQNPIQNENTFKRHDLQFAKISTDGHIIYSNLGYNGIKNETEHALKKESAEWEFSEQNDSFNPTKHIILDEHKETLYTETWNYSENEPVKYEMKDSYGKIISIIKESADNQNNLRREHVFYDENGKTESSVSIVYKGENLVGFTYYNSDSPANCLTITSEYKDGQKTSEQVYNENYELKNTFEAEYADGERKYIIIK